MRRYRRQYESMQDDPFGYPHKIPWKNSCGIRNDTTMLGFVNSLRNRTVSPACFNYYGNSFTKMPTSGGLDLEDDLEEHSKRLFLPLIDISRQILLSSADPQTIIQFRLRHLSVFHLKSPPIVRFQPFIIEIRFEANNWWNFPTFVLIFSHFSYKKTPKLQSYDSELLYGLPSGLIYGIRR